MTEESFAEGEHIIINTDMAGQVVMSLSALDLIARESPVYTVIVENVSYMLGLLAKANGLELPAVYRDRINNSDIAIANQKFI